MYLLFCVAWHDAAASTFPIAEFHIPYCWLRLGNPVLNLDYLLETIAQKVRPLNWTAFWEKQVTNKLPLKVVYYFMLYADVDVYRVCWLMLMLEILYYFSIVLEKRSLPLFQCWLPLLCIMFSFLDCYEWAADPGVGSSVRKRRQFRHDAATSRVFASLYDDPWSGRRGCETQGAFRLLFFISINCLRYYCTALPVWSKLCVFPSHFMHSWSKSSISFAGTLCVTFHRESKQLELTSTARSGPSTGRGKENPTWFSGPNPTPMRWSSNLCRIAPP